MFKKLSSFIHSAPQYVSRSVHALKNSAKPREVLKMSMLGVLLFGNYTYAEKAFSKAFCQGASSQLPAATSAPSFQPYSHSAYEEAVAKNKRVVILYNNERFKESFIEKLRSELTVMFQHHVRKPSNQIVFLVFSPKTPEELQEFQEHHKISLSEDAVILMKSRYVKKLEAFTPEDYFYNTSFLSQYMREVARLNQKNFKQFADNIWQLHSSDLLIIAYNPKDGPDYKNFRDRFGIVSLQDPFPEKGNTTFLQITDPKVAESLNLKDIKPGDIVLLSKTSKYNFKRSTTELGGVKVNAIQTKHNMKGDLRSIIDGIQETTEENFLFRRPYFYHGQKPWRVRLEVNRNAISKNDFKAVVEALAHFKQLLVSKYPELSSKVSFSMVTSDASTKKGYKIIVSDEVSISKDMNKPVNTDPKQIIHDTGVHSYLYKYPFELSVDRLFKFLQDAMDKKVPDYFQSQKRPKYQKYSKKVVGKNFRTEIGDGNNHAIFFYSNHCHSCRRYGNDFEQLALKNLQSSDSKVQFTRMNSDKNAIDSIPAFHYTPVFMVSRKENPFKPYVFRGSFLDRSLLEDFINLSVNHEVMPQTVVDGLFTETKLKEVEQAKAVAVNLKKEHAEKK